MPRYRSAGLEIDADVDLPLLPPGSADRPPDVTIRCHSPGPLKASITTDRWDLGEGWARWRGIGGAECICRDGKEIFLLDSRQRHDETSTLLAVALGIISYQRGAFVLHAAIVERDGFCLGLSGPSGSGKSTVAQQLFRLGFSLLADDVAVCRFSVEGLEVEALYPATRRRATGTPPPTWRALGPSIHKQVSIAVPFCGESRKLSHLVVLQAGGDDEQMEVRRLSPAEAVPVVRLNSYRTRLAEAMLGRHSMLRVATAVARVVQVTVIRRPGSIAPRHFARAVVAHVGPR